MENTKPGCDVKGNLWVEADAKRDDEERPDWKFDGFHHLEFYVANAKQVSDWYCLRMGFSKIAYRGLETGSRTVATHVIKAPDGDATLAFSSPLNPDFGPNGGGGGLMMDIAVKGDAVKCVAFNCNDAKKIFDNACKEGAKAISPPKEYKDENGTVIMATIETYGQCTHTLVQNVNYNGPFLPGFKAVEHDDPIMKFLPPTGVARVDHVVGNQPDNMMRHAADWYYKTLRFHRFWSVDDKQIHTEYSSLRSEVVADFDHTIKMPINEPANGKKKSQIQEYVDYHGGAGVQHIAFSCKDVCKTIEALRARGMKFLSIPKKYYDNLRKRLANSPVNVKEDLDKIEQLGLLCDFDDEGYLLQLFTQPLEDRPTLFFEFIQRENNEGFGVGNFKALFESIERAQEDRGNL